MAFEHLLLSLKFNFKVKLQLFDIALRVSDTVWVGTVVHCLVYHAVALVLNIPSLGALDLHSPWFIKPRQLCCTFFPDLLVISLFDFLNLRLILVFNLGELVFELYLKLFIQFEFQICLNLVSEPAFKPILLLLYLLLMTASHILHILIKFIKLLLKVFLFFFYLFLPSFVNFFSLDLEQRFPFFLHFLFELVKFVLVLRRNPLPISFPVSFSLNQFIPDVVNLVPHFSPYFVTLVFEVFFVLWHCRLKFLLKVLFKGLLQWRQVMLKLLLLFILRLLSSLMLFLQTLDLPLFYSLRVVKWLLVVLSKLTHLLRMLFFECLYLTKMLLLEFLVNIADNLFIGLLAPTFDLLFHFLKLVSELFLLRIKSLLVLSIKFFDLRVELLSHLNSLVI